MLRHHQNAPNRTITLQVSVACTFSAMDYDVSSVYILAATIGSKHPPLHPFVHIQAGLDHRNSTHHRNMCCFLNKYQQNKFKLYLKKPTTTTTQFIGLEHSNTVNCTEVMKRMAMNSGNVTV